MNEKSNMPELGHNSPWGDTTKWTAEDWSAFWDRWNSGSLVNRAWDPHVTVKESWDANDLVLVNGDFSNYGSTSSKTFVVSGTEDERLAVSMAYDEAPDTIPNPAFPGAYIPKSSASVSERCSEKVWKITVSYAVNRSGSNRGANNRDNEISFDCSASSTHVLRPYDQVCVKGGMDHDRARRTPIGWNGQDGKNLSGTGIDVPTSEIRERYTKYMRYHEVISSRWKHKVLDCFGKINNRKFKGWNPGEVLFLGCSYSTPERGVSYVAVTFEFLIRLNEKSHKVGGVEVGSKIGHDYVWATQNEEDKDEKAKHPVNEIRYVFKARVYKETDLNKLGI